MIIITVGVVWAVIAVATYMLVNRKVIRIDDRKIAHLQGDVRKLQEEMDRVENGHQPSKEREKRK